MNAKSFFFIIIYHSLSINVQSKLNSSKIRQAEEQEDAIENNVWPRGKVPYLIDDFSFDKVLRDRIRGYLAEASVETSLQFLEMQRPPEDDQTRWVLFVNRRGLLQCDDYYAANFTRVGVQRVTVGYDCVGAANAGLAAAVLALVGVPPQHNSPDRDRYIEIMKDNILPDKIHLFDVIPNEDWPFKDSQYDFASAGHYDTFKYTKNGLATIRTKSRIPNAPSGEPVGLSAVDKLKIRNLYEPVKRREIDNTEICSNFYKNNGVKRLRKKIADSFLQAPKYSGAYLPSKKRLAYMSDFYYEGSS